MKRLRAGIIDRCVKLGLSDLNGLVTILCEHICVILSAVKVQSQTTKGLQNKNKNLACNTQFIATFTRLIGKLGPLCNLTACKSMTEKGRIYLGSNEVKFST